MKGHENPFRISRAQDLRFRGPLSLDQILERLTTLGYRGAIVGPEGCGKTTLLRELEGELTAAGFSTRLLRFDELALFRRVSRETILLIDGAEKLPWILHLVLVMTTPRIIVTSHGRREALPVLLECAASPALMEELLIELAGPDPALVSRAKLLFKERRGNVRQVFSALYDVLAEGA